MAFIHRLRRRMRLLLRRDDLEAELADELRDHIEREAEELLREGRDPEAARREAYRRFGGEERTKERVRDERGGRLVADVLQDLSYAGRSLRKAPGFTASILVVLALGIGAPTALFSIVNGVLLKPLPYPEPDRLVRVWPAQPNQDIPRDLISYPDFADWRERVQTLSHLGTYLPPFLPDWTLTRDGEATEQLATTWVGGDFFSALGAPPAMGRWLEHRDVELERSVVVLSHGAWERVFGSDPDIVGRTVSLDFQQREIVGVMPEGFDFPNPGVDVWTPLHTAFPGALSGMFQQRGISTQYMVGRLAEGATPESARDELGRIARDLEATYPTNAGESDATVDVLRDNLVGDVRGALWSLLGAVVFFLLLATANAASLLLARGADRTREIALRKSLGASSPRITRQIVTETAGLAVVAGVLGIGLARLLVGAVRTLPAEILPRAGSIQMDATVLLVAVVLTVAVTALAGFAPALRMGRGSSPGDIRTGGRRVSADRGSTRQRSILVAGEVAVAVVLIVGAGLLIRSFNAISSVDTGFSPDGAIAMTVNAPPQRYQDDASRRSLFDRMLERIQAIPGVTVAGATPHLPFRSVGEGYNVNVPGIFEPPPDQEREARALAMTPTAFDALGMSVIDGRGFTPADGPDDPLVAVVNEAMVQEFFQGRDPVGERFSQPSGPGAVGGLAWEVVGVVRDVTLLGPTEAAPSTFYWPMAQYPRLQQITFIARTDDDPLALVGPMRAVAQELDPELPILEIISLDRLSAEVRAQPRFFTSVMAGFAGLALVLAALGVYGVLAYVVRGRTKEMGIRSALGATRNDVLRHVMTGGLRPALIGLALGVGAAAVLSRYLESLLFDVTPLDPIAFVAGASVIAITAVVACAVPAVSAARVDPMASLREE